MARGFSKRAFTVVEVSICLVVVAVLLAVLLPFMLRARASAKMTTCSSNLRQFSAAWATILERNNEFPAISGDPAWSYGGVEFLGLDKQMQLASGRPLNQEVADETRWSLESVNLLYRCPADFGALDGEKRATEGRLFDIFGTSYPANPLLLAGTSAAGEPHRSLRLDSVTLPADRLILMGDAEWYLYAADHKLPGDERSLTSPWHGSDHVGNVLMLDYSVKTVRFQRGESADYLFKIIPPVQAPGADPMP